MPDSLCFPDATNCGNLTSEQDELLRKIIPYEYWYTPYIESDHHVDFENIPPEAEEVLSYTATTKYLKHEVAMMPTVI